MKEIIHYKVYFCTNISHDSLIYRENDQNTSFLGLTGQSINRRECPSKIPFDYASRRRVFNFLKFVKIMHDHHHTYCSHFEIRLRMSIMREDLYTRIQDAYS